MIKKILLLLIFCTFNFIGYSQPNEETSTQREVIYSRKDGMALTLFVTTPKTANNKAILYIASGGYFSTTKWLSDYTSYSAEYLKRGYTVFIVFHSSVPMYSGLEIVSDIQKAVQHVRYHAKEYNIDADHIGITGSSAGANLSLIMGISEGKSINPDATPEERTSTKVQAVACFFPPTDFLNYGKENSIAVDNIKLLTEHRLLSAFQFKEYNADKRTMEPITDRKKILEVLKQMSPNQLADATTAPTLIYHGDTDALVPYQQATMYINKLESLKVPSKLITKKGGGHGWTGMSKETGILADWFDTYLKQ